MPIKYYSPESHKNSSPEFFSPIVKGNWNNLSRQERFEKFHAVNKYFQSVEDIKDSEIYLLPLTWNYYLGNKCINLANQSYKEAKEADKPFVIFSLGDHTANIPYDNAVIIQSSAFKSRDGLRGQRLLAFPPLIGDYLEMYCEGQLKRRIKGNKPVIGFCGQAGGSIVDFTRRQTMILIRRLAHKVGFLHWEQPLIEPTRFRKKILDRLNKNSELLTNYLIRTRYRAGYWERRKDPKHLTRLEFINNILNSDYTVCVRGRGNYSVRFYETLALGRIPIFINTDCLLPFQEDIRYSDFCVWIEEEELPYAAEKITDFHNSLSKSDFIDLQRHCRYIWKEFLSSQNYFNQLSKIIIVERKNCQE
jgi:hypothetical protein